ncbi:MAG: type III pantothenate kinase [Flavobacteriaceae bacterium]|nr:type III pantothenate kinase [Flavobacteriaceae bacterium]
MKESKIIIDSGNSLIKTYVFEKEEIIFQKTFKKENLNQELLDLKRQFPSIRKGIISDVSGIIKKTDLEQLWNNLWFLNANKNLKCPFTTKYTTLDTLGSDRIALISGATLDYKNASKLIIDMGSCITYDLLDDHNVHHGGAISPGYQMRYRILKNQTGQLPHLKIQQPHSLWGKTTDQSIHSGIHFGIHQEIVSRIQLAKSQFHPLKVIGTGGDIHRLANSTKNRIFVIPLLVAQGLNYLLELNS